MDAIRVETERRRTASFQNNCFNGRRGLVSFWCETSIAAGQTGSWLGDTSSRIAFNWWVWDKHWRKNGRYICRATTKWFLNMTTPPWKCINRKSYSTRRFHYTLSFLIISCCYRWLNCTSIVMKMSKNGSTLR